MPTPQAPQTAELASNHPNPAHRLPAQPLHTPDDYSAAIEVLEGLMELPELGPEERDYLGALQQSILTYQHDHAVRLPAPTLAQILQHLMDSHGIRVADLAATTGLAESNLAGVLTGGQPLTLEQSGTLARYFHVGPGVFCAAD